MSDTTFHTLDDIKAKAEKLGYSLVQNLTSSFKHRLVVRENITIRPRPIHVLRTTVIREADKWWICLTMQHDTDIEPISVMFSTGRDAGILANHLNKAVDEVRRLNCV